MVLLSRTLNNYEFNNYKGNTMKLLLVILFTITAARAEVVYKTVNGNLYKREYTGHIESYSSKITQVKYAEWIEDSSGTMLWASKKINTYKLTGIFHCEWVNKVSEESMEVTIISAVNLRLASENPQASIESVRESKEADTELAVICPSGSY